MKLAITLSILLGASSLFATSLVQKAKDSGLEAIPAQKLHTPEQFGQPADLHPDTLPELIRTASRFIFGQF
ncbi:hypothetical protein [Aliarcobacter butzleri]|uniref:hypothetical protein n=1 Tax=Aliarcobacter butzleri TaxID=28197 RepID=UPI001D010D8F|nr:hypothetical protein [Aliarcobacter butzleri]